MRISDWSSDVCSSDLLTAERFVPDAVGPPDGRLYRTGDRVRYLPDGRIEFVGRADHQVKIRGFRIEPGEIEATLARHAGVKSCAVIARDDSVGGKQLVAYYVCQAEAPTAPSLRAFLAAALPDFMVPKSEEHTSELQSLMSNSYAVFCLKQK